MPGLSLFRCALLAAALLPAPLQVHAQSEDACSGECARLLSEGGVLQLQGKAKEAFARYKAASEAAPKASAPLAATAHLYLVAADANPQQAETLRKEAGAFARGALKRFPGDPLAQEVLRMLENASPLRLPNQAAAAELQEAEILFTKRDYAAALERYQRAMRLDPAYSGAWVGAGDCWYMRQDWAAAEAQFRRAAEIEPRNAQAWRFLSDSLAQQGKFAEAEGALLSGIAADPSQLPNWGKLATLRARAGKPLNSLGLRRDGVAIGADGKATISVDSALQKASKPLDNAVRLALAMAEANARVDKDARARSPFEIELESWRLALKVADESGAGSGEPLRDPALVAMQALGRDGQLEPAILILLYREAYRPEYERWLAAHPDGVRQFIDRHRLRP